MDACFRLAERPFQDFAPLREKHFCQFVEFFFGILRSAAEFLRFREFNWDVFANRLHMDPIHFLRGVYTGSDPELLAFTRDRIQNCSCLHEIGSIWIL